MNATELVLSSLAALDQKEADIKATNDEVSRLRALLEAAEQNAKSVSGYMMNGHRHARRRGLGNVKAALDAGKKGIVVFSYGSSKNEIPGAILSHTKARLTVLTERGEMVFDLKGSTWKRPGDGMDGRRLRLPRRRRRPRLR